MIIKTLCGTNAAPSLSLPVPPRAGIPISFEASPNLSAFSSQRRRVVAAQNQPVDEAMSGLRLDDTPAAGEREQTAGSLPSERSLKKRILEEGDADLRDEPIKAKVRSHGVS